MKPVEQWSPKVKADAITSCKAARQKYLKLGREVEKVADPGLRSDLIHTHSKLGIFLAEVLGKDWTEWLTGDPDQEMWEAFG